MKEPIKPAKPKKPRQVMQAPKGKGQGAFGFLSGKNVKSPYAKPLGRPKKAK